MMTLLKPLLLGLVSILSLLAIVIQIDLSNVAATFLNITPSTLALMAGCIVLSNFLAFLRFQSVLGSLGFHPPRAHTFFSFSLGQIGNYFLLNILGQSITRAMALKKAGTPFGASVAATYVERLLAIGLLLIFSLAGLGILSTKASFDIQRGGAYILNVAGSMAIVVVAISLTVFRSTLLSRETISKLRFAATLWPSVILTTLSLAAMLGAYLTMLVDIHPNSLSLEAAAALTIVMFLASMPISLSGWGVRELTAAAALSYLGMPASTGIAVAVAVGLLSLIIMFVFAGISVLVKRSVSPPTALISGQALVATFPPWDRLLINSCAFFCAAFIFFQVRVPLASSDLMVNVADVAAITGLAVIVLLLATNKLLLPLPRFALVILGGITAVLVGGIFVAYGQDIIGQWGLINRGLGWIVLIGYAAVGATAVAISGERIRMQIMQCSIVSALSVCAVQFALMAFSSYVQPLTRDVYAFPLQGFVNNQNAFMFQLATVGIITVVCAWMGYLRKSYIVAVFALLTVTIFYSKSRTGIIYVGALSLWIYLETLRHRIGDPELIRKLRTAVLAAIAILIGNAILPYVLAGLLTVLTVMDFHEIRDALQTGDPIFNFHTLLAEFSRELVELNAYNRMGYPLERAGSEIERWMSLQGGWQLFLDHPFWGAGLGAYMERNLASGLPPQVIHSIPVWFLAETGLIGTGLVAVCGWYAIRATWKIYQRNESAPFGWGILGLMGLMFIGGIVHDFLYQRIFWFMFGVLAALPVGQQRGKA